MAELQYIPLSELHHHPKNPRLDLGDLTELTESIKSRGVMQNLTVVPRKRGGGYYVVIGNRRMEASKMAGLDQLPCVVVQMTEKEQMSTMLLENMQRSDLTVYEQAHGFQMMMDLGMTTEEISTATGFSDATVRRRVKLSQFNKAKFKSACERGATLMQFAQIADIEDEDLRSEALNAVGTTDYNHVMWKVRNAREKKAKLPLMVAKLNAFASEIKQADGSIHMWINSYHFTSESDLEKISRPSSREEYVYIIGDTNITLYVVRKPDDDAAVQAKREAAERLKARISRERELAAGFKSMRDLFMSDLFLRGREEAAQRFVLWVLSRSEYLSSPTIGGMFQKTFLDQREKQPESYTGSIKVSLDEIMDFPVKSMLLGMVLTAYDRISQGDMTLLDRYSGKPKAEENTSYIRGLYRHMEAMGYTVSTEEREWLNGTHECFQQMNRKENEQ